MTARGIAPGQEQHRAQVRQLGSHYSESEIEMWRVVVGCGAVPLVMFSACLFLILFCS